MKHLVPAVLAILLFATAGVGYTGVTGMVSTEFSSSAFARYVSATPQHTLPPLTATSQKPEHPKLRSTGSEPFKLDRLTWTIVRVTDDPVAVEQALATGEDIQKRLVRVDVEITNHDRVRHWLNHPRHIALVDENGEQFPRLSKHKVATPIGMRFNKNVKPGDTVKGVLLFEVDSESTNFQLVLGSWRGRGDATVKLTPITAQKKTNETAPCIVDPSAFLLYGQSNENKIGLTSLKTVDWGRNGRVTSAVVYAHKEEGSSWHPYHILLEIGRSGIGGKSRLTVPVTTKFKPRGACVTGELIGRMPLAVSHFDEQQIVSITLRPGKGPAARAQGVFDLATFAG